MSIIARKITYTVEYSSTSRPSKSQQIASLSDEVASLRSQVDFMSSFLLFLWDEYGDDFSSSYKDVSRFSREGSTKWNFILWRLLQRVGLDS